MRLVRTSSAARVTTTTDRRRPVVLTITTGLAFQLSRTEALALADQLVDHAERTTDV